MKIDKGKRSVRVGGGAAAFFCVLLLIETLKPQPNMTFQTGLIAAITGTIGLVTDLEMD